MRCIFCKQNSSASKSVEHIIPESLGNVDHTLPAGVVCDGCNNYFAREVEKPFLESSFCREKRFQMIVPNKRGRVPHVPGIHLESLTKMDFFHMPDGTGLGLAPMETENQSRWMDSLQTSEAGTLIVLHTPLPQNDHLAARFIAKVGLEVLAFRMLNVAGWNEELVGKVELDELRNYARRGGPGKIWPISIRRIYSADFLFGGDLANTYEVLHEFDILVTRHFEHYIVVALFGVEFALNLAGRELVGYEIWLQENGGKSPLYSGKNQIT